MEEGIERKRLTILRILQEHARPVSSRHITPKGRSELTNARVIEKLGFLSARIDEMTYAMRFDPDRVVGSVISKACILEQQLLERALPLITRVFQRGFGMKTLLALYPPGDRMGEDHVSEGFVGIGTVCSITLNGVLLSRGIPTRSRFGGPLGVESGKPGRFIATGL